VPRLLVVLCAAVVLLGGGPASAGPRPRPGKTRPATKKRATAPRPVLLASSAAVPAVPRPPPPPPELLLTFDDGPNVERTPKVLDVLEKHHLHAVFFVNGARFLGESAYARKARAVLKDALARGHAIGNHTIHHYFLCGKVYSRRVDEEVEGNARLIEQAIGQRPELYRTPYGAHCPTLGAALTRLGVHHTAWDIDPQDWKVQNTAKVRDYVISQLRQLKHGRQILLMHDIHQCTVEALPQILDWLDAENAARVQRGEAPIRVIDYAYLLPPRPLLPGVIDGVGRVLIDGLRLPDPRWLWSAVTGGAPRA